MQAFLSSNKLANDFRNDTKESDPMEVDYFVTLSMARWQMAKKQKQNCFVGKMTKKGNDKDQGKGKGTDAKPQVKEYYVCGKKGHFAQDCFSRIHHDKTVNELEGARVAAADAAKKILNTNEKHSESRGRTDDVRQRSIRQRLLQLAWRSRS